MSGITTHVLDLAAGRPAAGVSVAVEAQDARGGWTPKGQGTTDADGRIRQGLTPVEGLAAGAYRLRFDTGAYFRSRGVESFYPEVVVTFVVRDASQPHHVPLLLSPFGYSTYRGS